MGVEILPYIPIPSPYNVRTLIGLTNKLQNNMENELFFLCCIHKTDLKKDIYISFKTELARSEYLDKLDERDYAFIETFGLDEEEDGYTFFMENQMGKHIDR